MAKRTNENPIFNTPGPLDGMEWDDERKYFYNIKVRNAVNMKTEKQTRPMPSVRELRKLFISYLDHEYQSKPNISNRGKLVLKQAVIDIQFLNRFHHMGDDFQFHEFYILVKPLERISKEECVATYNYLFPTHDDVHNDVREFTIKAALGQMRIIEFERRYDSLRYNEVIKLTDYFRELGYALPYKNWSVKDLLEFGIYKLIETCQHEYVTNIPSEPTTCRKCGHRWG